MTSRDTVIRALLLASVLLVWPACADKTLLAPGSRSPVIPLRLAAQVSSAGRVLDVHVWYERTAGPSVALHDERINVEPGDRVITVTIDLTPCLADPEKAGAGSGCPLRVGLALRDSASLPLDSVALGPFDALPGRPPTIPQVGLAVQRFTVHQWVGDDALRLGGPGAFTFRSITGYVDAAGNAVPVVSSARVDPSDGHTESALAALENGRWRQLAVVTGAAFRRAIALSPTEIWIAANEGLYRYDGTSINAINAVRDSLVAVAAVATPAGRLVVGAGPTGRVWRGDGTTWTRDNVANENFLDACANSAQQVFIGSKEGSLFRFNGTAWALTTNTIATSNAAPKGGMLCPDASTAFAFDTTALLRWNGQSWVTQDGPYFGVASPLPYLIQWGASAATDMFAVSNGNATTTAPDRAFWRLGPNGWRQVGTLPFVNSTIVAPIWADPRGGRAFVASNFGRVEKYEGDVVSLVAYSPAIRDVSVNSQTSAFAVGWNLFLARWNGASWTIDAPPTGISRVRLLQGVWSDGASNAWAVGTGTTLLHWIGTNWRVVTAPGTMTTTSAVWGRNSTVFVVGTQIIKCLSEACAFESAPSGADLNSVWGADLQNVFAVGVGGRIVRYDGQSWTSMTSPTTRTLFRVWGSGANDVWAVGDSVLVRYDGTAWHDYPMAGDLAQMKSGPSSQQSTFQLGLWGSAPNDVYLGGDRGRIARFDGTAWTLMPTGESQRRILSISGAAGLGAIALADPQYQSGGPALLRGIGATGAFGAPFSPPTIWY